MAAPSTGTPLAAHTKTPQLKHSAWIEVNLDNLQHNLGELEKHSKVPVLPVLKGDAYGHGAPAIAAFLKKQGYKRLAVSTVDEALPIVRKVRDVSILLLTPPLPDQLDLVCKYRLTPTVCTGKLIHQLTAIAKAKGQRTSVELKIDTGLGRLGARLEEIPMLAALIKKTPWLKLQGVFTHFSAAFADPVFSRYQLSQLLEVRTLLQAHGWHELYWHAANSAAFVLYPESHLNLVRIGTLLYGQSPVPLDDSWQLLPTWECKARIIQIRQFAKGETIGYGREYRTKRPVRAGIIPLGYSHGLMLEPEKSPWRQIGSVVGRVIISPPSPISHNKKPLPILGRIGMGLTCVDLSSVPELEEGDVVTAAMRRVTASQSLPKIYLVGGRLRQEYP